MIIKYLKFINENKLITNEDDYKLVYNDDFKSYNLYDKNNNSIIGQLQVSYPYNDRNLDISLQNKKCINIFNVYIEEDYRNKGFGKFILEKVIKNLKDKCDIITLQVLSNNEYAIKLYKSLGFETFYNPTYGVIHMKKEF
jgi:ribosomal protein S18 acetylase RimI-like enzyme